MNGEPDQRVAAMAEVNALCTLVADWLAAHGHGGSPMPYVQFEALSGVPALHLARLFRGDRPGRDTVARIMRTIAQEPKEDSMAPAKPAAAAKKATPTKKAPAKAASTEAKHDSCPLCGFVFTVPKAKCSTEAACKKRREAGGWDGSTGKRGADKPAPAKKATGSAKTSVVPVKGAKATGGEKIAGEKAVEVDDLSDAMRKALIANATVVGSEAEGTYVDKHGNLFVRPSQAATAQARLLKHSNRSIVAAAKKISLPANAAA